MGWSRTITAATLAFTVVACVLLFLYGAEGHDFIRQGYLQQSLAIVNRRFHPDGYPLEHYIRKADRIVLHASVLGLALVVTVTAYVRSIEARSQPCQRLSAGLYYTGCLTLGCAYLAFAGYEGREWYAIGKVMAFQEPPPFQHRILFSTVANLLKSFWPGHGDLHYYFASQFVAMGLMLYWVRKLAALFVNADLSRLSCLLALGMWTLTYTYYTFYDLGIIFVYSLCLYLLFTERHILYLAAFSLGTLNHESTLFLVPVAALLHFNRGANIRKPAAFLVAQLLCYGMVRAALFHYLPADQAYESGKLAFNMELFRHSFDRVALNMSPMIIWFGVALAGFRHAPRNLRVTVVLLPLLTVMTLLMGQFNESRQFDAFIPSAVALVLCFLAAKQRERSTFHDETPSARGSLSLPPARRLADRPRPSRTSYLVVETTMSGTRSFNALT